jgi:Phage stabilisation protein
MRTQFPINGVVGQGRSLNSNPGKSHNCYIEQAADGQTRLVKRAGQSLKFTLPNSPVRGCFADTEVSYWAAGNGIYRRNSDNTILVLGTIDTFSGTVNFASSGTKLMVVDGNKGYEITLATNAFAQVVDANFPALPVNASYLSGFWVVTAKSSQQFFFRLASSSGWNGLDFATAESNPDNILSQKVLNDELYLIGFKTVEVWNTTGNGASPFQRNRNVAIDHGCVAANSAAKAMDALYWLGGDNMGHGIVWRLNGYQVERISTHEIEQQIAVMPFIDDTYSITYQIDGHVFYILQFPSADKSLGYDIMTGLWHTLSSKDVLTGLENIWRASCHCFSGSSHLVGDTISGKVYDVSMDYYTDDGTEIIFWRTGLVMRDAQYTLFYKEIIINMEVGVGNNLAPGNFPVMSLRWSDDAGHSWSNCRQCTIGKIGQYQAMVRWDMLGSGRNRVWEIRCTDPVKLVVLDSSIDYEKGLS